MILRKGTRKKWFTSEWVLSASRDNLGIGWLSKSYPKERQTKVKLQLELVKRHQSLIRKERRMFGVLRSGQCSCFICIQT